MKKPSIPMKKKSGPNTTKGKLVSAQNAIKTGVTTKQLLNEEEYSRFAELQADLTNHYNGTNPLIALQIEKIGRLQIQLERIQNAIDALYRKSEIYPQNRSKTEPMQDDGVIVKLRLDILLGILDVSIIRKIENALFKHGIEKVYSVPRASDELIEKGHDRGPIITQESLLGAYLYAEADFYEQVILDYLKDKKLAVNNARDAKRLYQKLNFEVLNSAIDRTKNPDLTDWIITDNLYEFRQLNDWFQRELSKLPNQLERLSNSIKADEMLINMPFPNFDDLDRLIRYQTTISRQLSTAIGELRILAA